MRILAAASSSSSFSSAVLSFSWPVKFGKLQMGSSRKREMGVPGGDSSSVTLLLLVVGGGVMARCVRGDFFSPVRDLKNPAAVSIKLLSLLFELLLVVGLVVVVVDKHSPLAVVGISLMVLFPSNKRQNERERK